MFAPIIDYSVKCIKCGMPIIANGEDTDTYLHNLSREEVVVRRCSCCRTRLAIPIRSKDECYKVDESDGLFQIMH